MIQPVIHINNPPIKAYINRSKIIYFLSGFYLRAKIEILWK